MKRLLPILLLLSCLSVSAQTKETYQYVLRDSALYLDILHPETPRADRAVVDLSPADATVPYRTSRTKNCSNAASPSSPSTTGSASRTVPL